MSSLKTALLPHDTPSQKNFCFWIVVLSLGLVSPKFSAQVKGIGLPDIKNYSKFDYQSGTQNWGIDQDQNGNIYFANNNGLLQFDGTTWHNYRLPNSFNIRSVKVDSISGRVYVGAYNEFGYFESASNGDLSYVSLIPLVDNLESRESDFIWKINIVDDEVIFQSFNYIYILNNNQIKVIHASGRFQFSFKAGNKIYFQDVTQGILEYQNSVLQPLKNTEVFNSTEIWGIFSLSNDGLLIATLEAGLFLYKGDRVIPWDTEANLFVKKNSSLGGVAINEELIVLNTVLSGIIICDVKTGQIIQHIDLNKGLKNNTVLSSFIDSKKNLWLGLDNGIAYVNINSPFTYFRSSLNFSSVYASVLHKDVLYVATNQGVFYHPLNGSFKEDSFKLVEGTRVQSWNIQVINDELICANNKGALIIKDNKVEKTLDQNGYFGFKEIPNHPNYVIGSNYTGFSIFEKSDKGLEYRFKVKGLEVSSKDFQLDEDYLWLKRDEYLYQLKLNDSLTSFTTVNTIVDLKGDGTAITTLQKLNNEIYFISNNHFYTFSKAQNSFVENSNLSTLFEDLPIINIIVEDKFGNFWYSYNESMGVMMKRKSHEYVNVSEAFSNLTGNLVTNYLPINTINSNNIFIGLINGLAHYDSEFLIDNTIKPKVLIRSFSFGKDTIVQGNPQQKARSFEIPYASNNVKFTFSSPEFENSESVLYSYQLKPFDEEWSKWYNVTMKEYTNLREGTYTINVKVKNSYGVESTPATLEFSISPPWYRHVLAYILYFLVFVLTVYIVRTRMKAKIRKNKYYETIEQRRIYLEKESKIKQEQYQLEKEVEKLNREKLQTKILLKDKELVNNSLQVVKKNKTLNGIIQKLKEMDDGSINDETKFQLNKLKKHVAKEINNDNSWKDLEKHVKNVHFEFLKRLKEQYPTISPRELDLSTYLLLNMSTKEIAEVMNISKGGVELARYRLRKKLGLSRKENLTGFLMKI